MNVLYPERSQDRATVGVQVAERLGEVHNGRSKVDMSMRETVRQHAGDLRKFKKAFMMQK
jgi:hypothetical protein